MALDVWLLSSGIALMAIVGVGGMGGGCGDKVSSSGGLSFGGGMGLCGSGFGGGGTGFDSGGQGPGGVCMHEQWHGKDMQAKMKNVHRRHEQTRKMHEELEEIVQGMNKKKQDEMHEKLHDEEVLAKKKTMDRLHEQTRKMHEGLDRLHEQT